MDINSERLKRSETYGKLREWAERLKKFEGVPDMYRDIPSYPQELTEEFKEASTQRATDKTRADFLEKHLDYLDNVRRQIQLKDPGYLKLQQLIAENSDTYNSGQFSVGLDPYKEMRMFSERIKGTANPFFSGLTSPAHELYGHLRPALLGIQPSIDPVTVPGFPGVYKPSIISPTNESLAHFMNEAIIRNLGATPETIKADPTLNTIRDELKGKYFPHYSTRSPGRNQTGLRDVGQIDDIRSALSDLTQQPLDKSLYTPYQAGRQILKQLRDAAPGQEPRRLQNVVDALRRSNYLSQSAFRSGEDIPEAFRNVITSNLISKYVDPSLNNFVQGLRISTPGFDKYANSALGVARGISSVDEASNVAASRLTDLVALDPSKNYSELGMMIFGADPVGAAAKGAGELARGLRRTPSALLPGAADLIPSPEAVRTGYRQGPAAMGKQMAQEFVQSLPTAAAAAGVLATPLAAPLAPGIGAGLVGAAGARALNEVVRQETGEGIVPKLRQAVGTAPRTGFASPTSAKPRPLTAQVRPLTAAQQAEIVRQQNRNELQRRIELAQQRFNPGKLEFGLSELLRGR